MELYILLFRWELIVIPAVLLAAAFAFLVPMAVNFGEVTKKSPRHELFVVLALLGQLPTALHALLAYRPRVVAAGCWALLNAGSFVGLLNGGSGASEGGGWALSPSIRPDTDHGPALPQELVQAQLPRGEDLGGMSGADDASDDAAGVLGRALGEAYDWVTQPSMDMERWQDVAAVLGPAAVDGVQGSFSRVSVQYQLISTAIGFLAMVIYVSQVPEKWYPGRFDLVGSSHNIWHVLGALSPLVWMWMSAPALMEWRWGADAAAFS